MSDDPLSTEDTERAEPVISPVVSVLSVCSVFSVSSVAMVKSAQVPYLIISLILNLTGCHTHLYL